MPTITDLQIQKNNKTRANVYIDGEFCCALEMLTVMKLGLKIGGEISAAKLREAASDSERSVAFEKAIGYLSRGYKTVHQTREYLTKRGYASDTVEYVIAKLKDYRYLDDEAYARMYVEQNIASKGARRIRQELIFKGISYTLAEQYSVQDPDTSVDNARRLASKYMKNKTPDIKELQRLQRYLLSRGYGFDVVNTVVRGYGLVE